MNKQDTLKEIGKFIDCIKKETISYQIGMRAITMEVNTYLCSDGE